MMSLEIEPGNSEDIPNDTLSLIGGTKVLENDLVHYGPLVLTVTPYQFSSDSLRLANQVVRSMIGRQSKIYE
jgi:hypothetical protein